MSKFYLHSAIPYVNAAPHIGHAQEFVYGDTIARFQKLLGNEVFYLCGADENALKIVQAAEKAHMPPQAFCDLHAQEFYDLSKKLNVHFDVWQRGTDRTHHFPASQKLWALCEKTGDIYKKKYTGLYCVGCEVFYTKDELNEKGECFEHPGKKLEEVSEENYFFKLSKYQTFLEDLIQHDKLNITPAIRKNEALAFVKRGLSDFSISRSKARAKNWGVPVPNDPDQIMYVWFDALNIYQSGIGFGWDEANYKKWWPPQTMVIGKGILRFHAIYWMAILKSAGLLLPKKLFVHGYVTVDGAKMSKTVGNVVDPFELISKYGTDALRYYFLREIPSTGDGDYSERRFKEIYNADLANGLGNLVARVAKLTERVTVTRHPREGGDPALSNEYLQLLKEYRFNEALELIWNRVKATDKWINDNEPWKIKDEQKLTAVLQKAVDDIRAVAFHLQPFLPDTAEKILTQFLGEKIKSSLPLFPRQELSNQFPLFHR
jgi:methionyl-tRNA synthetase